MSAWLMPAHGRKKGGEGKAKSRKVKEGRKESQFALFRPDSISQISSKGEKDWKKKEEYYVEGRKSS